MKSDFDYDELASAIVDKLAAAVPDLVRGVLDVLAAVQTEQRAHAFSDLARSTDARQHFESESRGREELARKQEQQCDDERNNLLSSTDVAVLSPTERVACQGGALLPADVQRRVSVLRKLQAASDPLAEELGLYWFALNEEERRALDNGEVPQICRDIEFKRKCRSHHGLAV